MFKGLTTWISNIVLALISLSGLFIAAHGGSDEAYFFGLSLAAIAFGILAIRVRHAIQNAA